MKVVKFGGSSLSEAKQLRKVANIIKDDPTRRIVVVSAPGKRFDGDVKVTDLLIALRRNKVTGLDTNEAISQIIERFESIINELGLSESLLLTYRKTLDHYLDTIDDENRLLDALKSCGED